MATMLKLVGVTLLIEPRLLSQVSISRSSCHTLRTHMPEVIIPTQLPNFDSAEWGKMQGNLAKFDARSYLEARFAGPNEFRSEFYLKNFHEFYQRFHTEWDAKTARLLEFGGGPCIHTLISAAPYVSEIVFADYAEDNLKEVKLWRDSDRTSFDWSSFFKYVVKELEGQSDFSAAAVDRESVLRSRVTSIIPCDIWQDDPIASGAGGESQQLFDIVSCSLTIVTTSKTLDEYKGNLRKLMNLLKPRGFYIGVEAVEVTWWSAGETKYPTVTFTAAGLHDVLREVGMEVLGSCRVDVPESSRFKSSDTRAYLFTVARKTL